MSEKTEEEKKKREIFESMSLRRQQRILKKGYDKWKPFLEPKEPPFFRGAQGDGESDAGQIFNHFLLEKTTEDVGGDILSAEYVEGAREICSALLGNRSRRARGILDFCLWISRHGIEDCSQPL